MKLPAVRYDEYHLTAVSKERMAIRRQNIRQSMFHVRRHVNLGLYHCFQTVYYRHRADEREGLHG